MNRWTFLNLRTLTVILRNVVTTHHNDISICESIDFTQFGYMYTHNNILKSRYVTIDVEVYQRCFIFIFYYTHQNLTDKQVKITIISYWYKIRDHCNINGIYVQDFLLVEFVCTWIFFKPKHIIKNTWSRKTL